MRRIQYIAIAAMLAVSAMLGGCGNNGACGGTAPSGSTVSLNKSTFSLTDASTTVRYHDEDFVISVKNKDGILLNNVSVTVDVSFAEQLGFVQLRDSNNNAALGEPATVCTEDNGTYRVRVHMAHGGLDYKFDLTASSGSASASAAVDVKSK